MTMKKSVKDMVAEANAAVETVSVDDARYLSETVDVLFVDIRDSAEVQASGTIPGALHVPRGSLEFKADPESPTHEKAIGRARKVVLFCASGGRSALAAKTLKDMGMYNVAHLAGGFTAWAQAGNKVQH